jgi:DNA-binding CsgD family transcriptional regulator
MDISGSYEIFGRFVDRYLPSSFRDIAAGSAFMKEMENLLGDRKQFFYAGDLLEMRIDFISQGIFNLLGLRAENLNPATIIRMIHPSDLAKLKAFPPRFFRSGTDLFRQKGGEEFLSVTVRFIRPDGDLFHALFQSCAFYSKSPYESVFAIVVLTDISQLPFPNHVQHHYVGGDPSVFRYPDEALLQIGHHFSNRELEILDLVARGLESEDIAKALFLSVHTVNTHRRNILRKTGNTNIHDLIFHLKEQGML